MSNLQITLSIVGVLLIIAIIGHGFWTMRRNNQQMQRQKRELSAKREQTKSSGATFDDDGVGEVRVVKKPTGTDRTDELTATNNRSAVSSDDNEHAQPSPAKKPADDVEQMSMNLDIDDDDAPLPSMRVKKDDANDVPQSELELNTNDEQTHTVASEAATTSDADELAISDKATETRTESTAQPSPQPPQEVISLFVKGSVQGAVLLQMMTELGCKFGDMGIFHRYEQTAGTGPLIFSVANMFNPGTFDLDNIENFETDGVALFMTLPVDYDGQQAFNMMLNAAKKLAMEIPQGQVLDGQRNVLSRQSIQKAHQQIREFEKFQANV